MDATFKVDIDIGESIIRQGFLCPFCMQDLGELAYLHAHVEKFHPESIPTSDAFDHLKGFIDKAKQKIRKFDSPFSSLDLPSLAVISSSNDGQQNTKEMRKEKGDQGLLSGYAKKFYQEIGLSYSHTDYLIKCRAPCINESAVQTNNLIIRLDKLINQCPEDINKRKAFEKETVPWVDNSQASVCFKCNQKFVLTKRRHHCRLCGRIMCHSCSRFLSFFTARKLTNPAYAAQMIEEINLSNQERETEAHSSNQRPLSRSVFSTKVLKNAVSGDSLSSMKRKSEKILVSTMSIIKGETGEVSLSSLLQQDANEHLRICELCKNLLDQRDEKMDQLASPPMIVVLYDRLCTLFQETHKLAPSYLRMAESLRRGETIYTLDSAIQLRSRLFNLEQQIDSVSLKIENLKSIEGSEQHQPSREIILQKNIRILSLRIVQELIVFMVNLPNEEQYKELKEKRSSEMKLQIQLERERSLADLKISYSNPLLEKILCTTSEKQTHTNGFVGTGFELRREGWLPSSTVFNNPFIDDDEQINPLNQQILIIKSYLKQAAEDGRLEEVEILEKNLGELEEELKRSNIQAF